MNPNIFPNKVLLLATALMWSSSPGVIAQVDATAWTSVKGTTIWARLDGMDGDKVILNMRGTTYRVPVSRLAPKSIEKLNRMLDLPPEKPRSIAKTKPATKTAAASPEPCWVYPERNSASRAASLPPLEDLSMATLTGIETSGQISELETEGISGSAALETTGEMPELTGTADLSTSSGHGMVLPPRGSIERNKAYAPVSEIRLLGKTAVAAPELPGVILTAVKAANRLQTKSYKWGGGRARLEDSGYDCSGSVSYVLIKAELLASPLNSSSFTRYGAPGRGRWITIHARHGHVFMTICGLRLDTGGSGGRGESGPRWRTCMRGTSGFVMRHPPGF